MRKHLLFFGLLLFQFISCVHEEDALIFDSSWESLEQYRCPDWFRDAKFGIFICWNPHAVSAESGWYARNMYIEGHHSYKYHLENFGHPSEIGYKDIIQMWKGEHFDPDELVNIYKEAGARYIVPIATYHDNFDLWNSTHHQWNSVNYGPKKDVIGMWKDATLKHDLRFGVTTHLARSWSWFQTSHGADKSGPYAGIPYDGNDPEFKDLYFETHDNHSFTYPKDPPEYWPKKWSDRLKDLIGQHQPDLLYFDGGIPFGVTGRELVAYFYNSNITRHKGELQAVLNIKNNSARPVGKGRFMGWHGDFRHGVGVEDIERGQRADIGHIPWQTDDSIGPWFWTRNSEYRSPKYVIMQLVDIVSKNGNLLLNVPLREDGTLDEEATHLLEEIGKWMKVNGEGIYSTRPFIHFSERPSGSKGGHFTEMNELTAEDIRFTCKGDTVYAFTGDLPEEEIVLKSFNSVAFNTINSVEMLGINEPLQFIQDMEALKVKIPPMLPCDYSVCLKIH
ncbi:MAG: alpha-L-fucosidase [Bacteroidetes bacterium]|nr:alpha-L-fucosidase [Bacteroidota bacterium]